MQAVVCEWKVRIGKVRFCIDKKKCHEIALGILYMMFQKKYSESIS